MSKIEGFEELGSQETESGSIVFSPDEFVLFGILRERDLNDSELQAFLEEKGIAVDGGDVEVSIGGNVHLMKTTREGFGTLYVPDEEMHEVVDGSEK